MLLYFRYFMVFTAIFTLVACGSSKQHSGKKKAKRSTERMMTDFSPLENQFFKDLSDGKLTNWDAVDAFMIASGYRNKEDLKKANAWFDKNLAEAKKDLEKHKDPKQKADHLLRWIHKNIFKDYKASSTDAKPIIDKGLFNCVSSCLLYGIMAQKMGYKVTGVLVDKHAFCRFYGKGDSEGIDVETTNEFGFNPGRDIKLRKEVISVPRNEYKNRKEIPLLNMVGVIYSNHLALDDLYETPEAELRAYQKAHLFMPNDGRILNNLKYTYQKLMKAHAKNNKWQKVREVAEDWQDDSDDKDHDWADGLVVELQNLVFEAKNRNSPEESRKILDDFIKTFPEIAFTLGQFKAKEYCEEAQKLIKQKKHNEALALFKKAFVPDSVKNSVKIEKKIDDIMDKNYVIFFDSVLVEAYNSKSPVTDDMLKLAKKAFPKNKDFNRFK